MGIHFWPHLPFQDFISTKSFLLRDYNIFTQRLRIYPLLGPLVDHHSLVLS
uniref:Uncharacterized protein n=1 Tax=Lepeophtheirus salmonis TaxID=72036 RepID=A0A0K2TX87_LEPSM